MQEMFDKKNLTTLNKEYYPSEVSEFIYNLLNLTYQSQS